MFKQEIVDLAVEFDRVIKIVWRKQLAGGSFSKGSQNRHYQLCQLFNDYQNGDCVQTHHWVWLGEGKIWVLVSWGKIFQGSD